MLSTYILFDAHLHIIDDRFPVYENSGYLPPVFTVSDYQNATSHYTMGGGAIVSGSFQRFDVGYLVEALDTLGDKYVGVAQLPNTCEDDEIIRLNEKGVRAVRFNLKRGGSEDKKYIYEFAKRIYELAGWHVELYVDAKNLDGLFNTLTQLPKVSIDHLGLSYAGHDTLLKLISKGVRVKATGFSRADFEVIEFMRKIYSENPDALMFGTDLPSTRAPKPYTDNDLLAVISAFDEAECTKILQTNAIEFYRPRGGLTTG